MRAASPIVVHDSRGEPPTPRKRTARPFAPTHATGSEGTKGPRARPGGSPRPTVRYQPPPSHQWGPGSRSSSPAGGAASQRGLASRPGKTSRMSRTRHTRPQPAKDKARTTSGLGGPAAPGQSCGLSAGRSPATACWEGAALCIGAAGAAPPLVVSVCSSIRHRATDPTASSHSWRRRSAAGAGSARLPTSTRPSVSSAASSAPPTSPVSACGGSAMSAAPSSTSPSAQPPLPARAPEPPPRLARSPRTAAEAPAGARRANGRHVRPAADSASWRANVDATMLSILASSLTAPASSTTAPPCPPPVPKDLNGRISTRRTVDSVPAPRSPSRLTRRVATAAAADASSAKTAMADPVLLSGRSGRCRNSMMSPNNSSRPLRTRPAARQVARKQVVAGPAAQAR